MGIGKQEGEGEIQASLRASQVAQMVKSQPVMQETEVGSLGWEDPLENSTEEPGGLWYMGSHRIGHN